jgi:hypothetical protein
MKWRPYWCTLRELALSYSNISYCFTTPLGPPITWVKTIDSFYSFDITLNQTARVFQRISKVHVEWKRRVLFSPGASKPRVECVFFQIFLGFIWRHKSDGGGSTLKQNIVIRVSRLLVLCISLVFGDKYMEFRTIFSLQYSISINTFEVDPPSDSLHDAVVTHARIAREFILLA